MSVISRGFAGRHRATDVKLPPGQYLTTDFPVLSAGPTPHVSLDRSTTAAPHHGSGTGSPFAICPQKRLVPIYTGYQRVQTRNHMGRGVARYTACRYQD
jgi:hypothetical protein